MTDNNAGQSKPGSSTESGQRDARREEEGNGKLEGERVSLFSHGGAGQPFGGPNDATFLPLEGRDVPQSSRVSGHGDDKEMTIGEMQPPNSHAAQALASHELNNDQLRNLPSLFIDTATATNLSGNPRAWAKPVQSSGASPSSLSIVPSHQQLPSNPRRSPRSRDRDYSLRRSLFDRNLGDPDAQLLEIQSVGPSKQESRTRSSEAGSKVKKKSEPTITVLPAADFEGDLELPLRRRKKGHSTLKLPEDRRWAQQRTVLSATVEEIRHVCRKAKNVVSRFNKIPPSINGRHIELGHAQHKPLIDQRTGQPYMDNTIRSNKYSAWSFLPRQFVAQFSKLANLYFLCVSILQTIPGLSTTGTYTTIIPLLFFVGISIAKEGYDDLRRHRLDKAENNSKANVLDVHKITSISSRSGDEPLTPSGENIWKSIKWQDIRVGDLVKLHRDDAIAADLALLHVEGFNGLAYVETMALDGETNLKSKAASPILAKNCKTAQELMDCRAYFVVEDPNLDLYSFHGKLTLNGETLPLTNNEVLYRGSILRNTSEIIGMVICSGEESKIRMNATKNPRIKAPALQAMVNKVVFLIVGFVLVLAIYNTASYEIRESKERRFLYLSGASISSFPILVSFVILFNTMIPLSLYVSLEIVKLFQMTLMNDIDMYDEASNTPMEARTSTINEELGQVSHVFSDKTGTLTNNSMRFRKMSVAGTAWTHDLDICKGSLDLTASPSKQHLTEQRTLELLDYLKENPQTGFAKAVKGLLLSMALCHTCTPEVHKDGVIGFQATSPDEQALVRAAQEMGYTLVDRQTGSVTIKITAPDRQQEPIFENYEVLQVIEFSSKRKRMSVIVRMPDNSICIYCKGADSTLMQLLRLSGVAAEKASKVEQQAHIRKSIEAQEAIRRKSEQQNRKDSMTRSSLNIGRTSLGAIGRHSLSAKRLEPIHDELSNWLQYRGPTVTRPPVEMVDSYRSPRRSALSPVRRSIGRRSDSRARRTHIEDDLLFDDAEMLEKCFEHIDEFATQGLRTLLYGYRYIFEDEYVLWRKLYDEASTSLVDRQDKIEEVAILIEYKLELAGATAIEDKLQDGVPATIDQLRRANIKVWMLTGDKRETAINIGRSCRLIQDYSTITVLDHEMGEIGTRIASSLRTLDHKDVAHTVVIIDGQTLSKLEAQEELYYDFIDLATRVDSVICCRASPSQKASLIRSVRKTLKSAITLAIGDGANDIAMIQEAHLGIGIAGKEGLQAARVSDYSIAQFRFLSKLLLVHGRWNYIRTCKYTLGTFWKEMMFYLTQALYQHYTSYTATSLYESWSLSMFNTLFTSLPVIFMGIFEADLKSETLLAIPELYSLGQKNRGFNLKIYLFWAAMAASEALLVFFPMLAFFGQANFTTDNGLYGMGTMTFTACIIIIATKLQIIELHNKTITCVIALIASIGGWSAWSLFLGKTYRNNSIYDVRAGLVKRWGRNALWWLTLLFIVTAVWLFELTIKYLRTCWRPTDVDVFQALEKDKGCWERIKAAARGDTTMGEGTGTERLRTAEEQEGREREVQELLERPRVMLDRENKGKGKDQDESDGSGGMRRRHSAHEEIGAGEVIEMDDLDSGTRGRERGTTVRRSFGNLA